MKDKVTITRGNLYRRVWAGPATKLAREYGLSDVGFAKLCRRNDIPLPPRGYWAKKAAGQTPAVPALPRVDEDWEIVITPHERTIVDPGLRAEVEKELAQAVPEDPIVVPDSFRGAHHLVAQSLRVLEYAEKDEHGLVPPPTVGCLDVLVSKDSRRRALLIMDALIKAFEVRGYHVTVLSDKEEKGTFVELMETRVPFGIREILIEKKEEAEDNGELKGRYEFRHSRFKSQTIPSGGLCLEIEPHRGYYSSRDGRRRKWSDGQKGRLEDFLNQFLAGVIGVATRLREDELEAERDERERKEEQARRAEQEAIRVAMWEKIKKEQAKVGKLSSDATAWAESRQIRAYIEAVRQDAVLRKKNAGPGSELGEWLLWAEKQADRLDPLKESPPSIVDDAVKYEQPERQRFW